MGGQGRRRREVEADAGHGNVEVRPPERSQPGRPQGGTRYTVQRGDTLWSIAQRAYGSGRHWRQIMNANPDRVGRGGDLIITGTHLDLPAIQVEGGEQAPETPAVEAPTPEAGDESPALAGDGPVTGAPEQDAVEAATPAVEPEGVCTEWGDFAIYPDDYEGPLPSTGADGVHHVHRATYDRIMVMAETVARMRRIAAVSEIDELLSYGAFDWAITDSEAREALRLLGGLPMSQLGPALDSLGQEKIDRLLDNLPASARGTDDFSKVVVGLGPSRAQPWIEALLSYGLFDWAVTDGDVEAVVDILMAMSGGQRSTMLGMLDQDFRSRLVDNMDRGSDLNADEKSIVQLIFDETSDAELMGLCLGVRFNLDVDSRGFWRGGDGMDWDEAGLRRVWDVLEALPPGHVQDNDHFEALLRYEHSEGSTSGGVFYGNNIFDEGDVAMTYDPANLGFNQDDFYAAPGDPLHGVNRFDKVVRHEVGHAVDDMIGGSDSYCIDNAPGGDWQEHGGSTGTVARLMVENSGGEIDGLDEDVRDNLIDALEDILDDTAHTEVEDRIRATSGFSDLDEAVQRRVLADPAVSAAKVMFKSQSPWYNAANGGVALGGRIYQESYDGRFVSYASAARARSVSHYQWRAPGEWFAEAYAAYYEPSAGEPGAGLAAKDPATKRWFDANVATATGAD